MNTTHSYSHSTPGESHTSSFRKDDLHKQHEARQFTIHDVEAIGKVHTEILASSSVAGFTRQEASVLEKLL